MLRSIWLEEGDQLREGEGAKAASGARAREPSRLWVDAEDPSDAELKWIEEAFGIHPAAMRDVAQPSTVPKVDSYDGFSFVLLHRVFYRFEDESCELRPFQVFLSEKHIVTIHSGNLARTFRGVGDRLRAAPAGFVKHGPSQILLSLLEAVVDDYRPVMEEWQEKVEEIEQLVLQGSKDPVIDKILQFKKMALVLRRGFFPQRAALTHLPERVRSAHLADELRPFLRNVIGEMDGLMHELESLSAHAASVFEIYAAMLSLDMTKSSHKLNIVMQRLSVVASVFMPLTFIVGVYGMNIEGIPELRWGGFYYYLWAFMAALAIVMLILFKRMKWY